MTRKKPSKTALRNKADRLFSLRVRARGVCEIQVVPACSGTLQCCHGLGRRYLSVRWTDWNAWAGCGACHVYMTHHPAAWHLFLRDQWGEELYWQRLRDAQSAGGSPDYAEIMERLAS